MNPWWPDEGGEPSEFGRSLLTPRLKRVSLPDSDNGTSGTVAYPVGCLGMAPGERTATNPVRPCLSRRIDRIGILVSMPGEIGEPLRHGGDFPDGYHGSVIASVFGLVV